MPVLTVVTTSPEQAERLQRITAGLSRQQTISYTDHAEHQYWINTIEEGRALSPRLRKAEILRTWITK